MSEEMIYSFVVRDVSVTMDEKTIKNDLMERYDGVAKVTRMFHDGEDDTPKTSVQVDFTLLTVAEKIRRDGIIVIGGICRRAYAIRKSVYQPSYQKPHRNRENITKPLCEEDLINVFEEQKKLLREVMNSLEDNLNNAITPRQDKTTQQPILSNKA